MKSGALSPLCYKNILACLPVVINKNYFYNSANSVFTKKGCIELWLYFSLQSPGNKALQVSITTNASPALESTRVCGEGRDRKPHCVAYRCGKTAEDDVTLFKFPKDTEEFCKWERQVQRSKPNWIASIHSYLCSDHFGKEYFEHRQPSTDMKLKSGAVPTVFVRPSCSSCSGVGCKNCLPVGQHKGISDETWVRFFIYSISAKITKMYYLHDCLIPKPHILQAEHSEEQPDQVGGVEAKRRRKMKTIKPVHTKGETHKKEREFWFEMSNVNPTIFTFIQWFVRCVEQRAHSTHSFQRPNDSVVCLALGPIHQTLKSPPYWLV